MPNSKTGGKITARQLSKKFLGVISNENISWKDHIKTVENKFSKYIDTLYRAKLYLVKNH